MMSSQPSSSKPIKFGDPNFEERLLQWYEDVDTDCSDKEDDVDENYAINSEHETDSEIELDSEEEESLDEDEAEETEESKKYYYGKNKFKWSCVPPTSNRGRRRQENIVVHLPGLRPQAQIGDICDPLTTWKFLFSNDICDIILRWTNYKIQQERTKYKNSNSPTLKDLDKTELYAVFGLLIYTALFKSNNENLDTIFATDGTGREVIRCISSKERFAFILNCLRFDNPANRIMRRLGNPVAPISEIFDIFVKNCQNCYTIGTHVCIDEMLVSFRGRCKFKMYLPNKPAKYGLKIMCCTDARNGYFFNGYIYSGKDCDGSGLDDAYKTCTKPTQSVMRLTKPLHYTNRNITFDNWFTSIELAHLLKTKGLTCLGTLKKNKREIPTIFLPEKKRQIGTALYGFTRELTLLSYTTKKNKAVLLLSSSHHHESTDAATNKPDMIVNYNSTKGGVDALDEKCTKFSCSRRSRRWPLTIFFRMIDISMANSYIIHQSYKNSTQIQRSHFIKELAQQLVKPHLESRARNEHISRKLRLSICEILGTTPPEVPEVRVDRMEMKKNCYICPYQKKRRTNFACYCCQKPICLECSRKMCLNCVRNSSN